MASNNAMTTALALPSSKTNWTAIVPARAPPPPPPVTQATMLKRTHEIQCGKCAISDYAENIGVWNDDGTLQELGLCGECEKPDIVGCCEKCDMEIVRDSDEHDNCLIGADDKFYCQHCPAAMCEMCESCYTNGGSISVLGRDISICENCDKGGDCYDGFLDEYHYNAETNDYEEKEDEPIPYCYENGKYSAPIPCGCPIPCAVASSDDESEEEDEQTCDGCGTTCLDHTSNKGRGSESPCEECEETRCKLCPCACEENQLLEEFWDGGMKEMWGEELREGHPLWEPFKLYKAMKKEQDA